MGDKGKLQCKALRKASASWEGLDMNILTSARTFM
jgi:hypothetical protein